MRRAGFYFILHEHSTQQDIIHPPNYYEFEFPDLRQKGGLVQKKDFFLLMLLYGVAIFIWWG